MYVMSGTSLQREISALYNKQARVTLTKAETSLLFSLKKQREKCFCQLKPVSKRPKKI